MALTKEPHRSSFPSLNHFLSFILFYFEPNSRSTTNLVFNEFKGSRVEVDQVSLAVYVKTTKNSSKANKYEDELHKK